MEGRAGRVGGGLETNGGGLFNYRGGEGGIAAERIDVDGLANVGAGVGPLGDPPFFDDDPDDGLAVGVLAGVNLTVHFNRGHRNEGARVDQRRESGLQIGTLGKRISREGTDSANVSG